MSVSNNNDKASLIADIDKRVAKTNINKTLFKPYGFLWCTLAAAAVPVTLLPAIGGALVLATAAGGLPVLAGAGAITTGLYGIYKLAGLLKPDAFEEKFADLLKKAAPKEATEEEAGKPAKNAKYFIQRVLGLASSAAVLGTSVALFTIVAATTSGFAAVGVAGMGVWLGLSGGLGTIARARGLIVDVKEKIEMSFLKDLPKEEVSAKPAVDVSPAPAWTGAEAGKNFNANAATRAGNDNSKPSLSKSITPPAA